MARTTPGVSGLLDRLEYHIKEVFIPVVIGKLHVSEELGKIFPLPARMGGLSITNICQTAELEYSNSTLATEDLTNAIFNQENTFTANEIKQNEIVSKIKKNRQVFFDKCKSDLEKELSPSVQRQLELLSEKGASSWLTSLYTLTRIWFLTE